MLVGLGDIQEQVQTSLPQSVLDVWSLVHREQGQTCWYLTVQKLEEGTSSWRERRLTV